MFSIGSYVLPLFRKVAARPASLAITAAVAAAAPASTAMAGHHRDNIQFDVDLRGGTAVVEQRRECPPVVEERQTRVWVEPVYRTVCDRHWVEPVYQTVCDHVWREPVVNTVCERVWVPDRYDVQDVARWRHGCRVIVRERVLLEP